MKTYNVPSQTPVKKSGSGMTQLLKRDKRQGSANNTVSKNRELQKLPLIKGMFRFNFF